jgi:regulator of sigma E protease
VRRAGAEEGQEETVEVATRGFDWGDTIVGTTDPDHPDQPFLVKELPLIDPLHLGQPVPSPFAYRRRMHLLAGKPAVLQVRRAGEGDSSRAVSILVPPAFHYTLGMRMKMGKVAGVRQESPAQEAGLMAGDVITRVSVAYAQEKPRELTEKELDPVRLPYELDRIIHGHRPGDDKPDPKKWRVTLTVQRTANHNAQQPQTLAPMEWDDTWQSGSERPVGMAAPMAIPQLGIAYWVESTVVAVQKGSPADQAGIQPNDVLRQIRFLEPGKKLGDEPRRGRWYDMFSLRGKEGKEKNYDEWAHFFWGLQHSDLHEVEVRVKRGEKDDDTPLGPMKAEADRTWPMADRGLLLRVDTRLQKASTLLEGLNFGLDRTVGFIKQIYLNLSSLVSGRISTKSLGGPIEIASQAFSVAGEDLWVFTLFLGIISINLAVVNFLPIPVLDGGHMVFLIYEKLRGKPPPEAVRNVATYIGLATILLLMGFVFYLDIKRHGWFSNWF